MKKRKARIIKDKKRRGEWAESVFMERAAERGLPISKPWGEMNSYDFVIGKPGRFVSVQVKSTICVLDNGYDCTVRGGHKAYRAGSFDFLAAYVVPEDAWYIIPATLIRGKKSVMLYPKSKTAKYEEYREAWHLLREASGISQEAAGQDEAGEGVPISDAPADALPLQAPLTGALGRMEASANFVRRFFEYGASYPRKPNERIKNPDSEKTTKSPE